MYKSAYCDLLSFALSTPEEFWAARLSHAAHHWMHATKHYTSTRKPITSHWAHRALWPTIPDENVSDGRAEGDLLRLEPLVTQLEGVRVCAVRYAKHVAEWPRAAGTVTGAEGRENCLGDQLVEQAARAERGDAGRGKHVDEQGNLRHVAMLHMKTAQRYAAAGEVVRRVHACLAAGWNVSELTPVVF